MTVEITYSFDGSALGGQNLVTFGLVFNTSGVKDVLLQLFNKIIGT